MVPYLTVLTNLDIKLDSFQTPSCQAKLVQIIWSLLRFCVLRIGDRIRPLVPIVSNDVIYHTYVYSIDLYRLQQICVLHSNSSLQDSIRMIA